MMKKRNIKLYKERIIKRKKIIILNIDMKLEKRVIAKFGTLIISEKGFTKAIKSSNKIIYLIINNKKCKLS